MWLDRCYILFAISIASMIKCLIAEEVDYKWACDNGKCLKTRNDPRSKDPALCLEACKMFCNEYGLLWPRPAGETDLGYILSKIDVDSVDVQIERPGATDDLMQAAVERFKRNVALSIPEGATPKITGKVLNVYLINQEPNNREFSLDMNENYTIRVSGSHDKVNATIVGGSFFGVRHGLETLSQLILYDDIRDHLLIVRDVNIMDKPTYPYRGVLLDTARNYYTVDSIKRTIEAMAAVKLNTFHWHITDSQSFPFVSERRPNFSKYGAYTPAKIYSKAAISDVVQFGLVRGVRVLPEFDAPAHVGEGWQDTDLTVCFKSEPWQSYCSEPPCGQLNPTRDELYDVLEDIYTDMAEVFKPDIFHMGGDEVSERCWNLSEEIHQFILHQRQDLDKAGFLNLWDLFQNKEQEKQRQDLEDFLNLWDLFQKKAQKRAYKAFGKKVPLILWTSTLTNYNYVDKYLNKDDYIIQVWTTGVNPQIQGLLKKGYRLILSNYDALYFDCGYGAWIGSGKSGNNWCSPYIGWQKVYDNIPAVMALDYKDQVLGGEAALWSEQSDSATLDGRLWPRAAALAERLWTEPATTWLDAMERMLHVRERFIRMGIQADSIQPEWCYQNEGYCYE